MCANFRQRKRKKKKEKPRSWWDNIKGNLELKKLNQFIGLKWLRILTVHSGYINFKIRKIIWLLNLQNEQIWGNEGTGVTDSGDVIRGWAELNNEQRHYLCSSKHTTGMSKSENMTWAGHIARICICVRCVYGASVSIWSSKLIKLYLK
jgi:hypothetical protein